jgi:hypothetical protein
MTGIFFFGILIAWFFAAKWLASKATQRMAFGEPRFLARVFLTVAIVIAPVADEIVGGFQFRALCAKNDALQTDSSRIEGKTVRPVVNPSRREIQSHAIKIYHTHVSYRDIESNEELASYSDYEAGKGLLKRALAALTGEPLSTGVSVCSTARFIKPKFNQVN